MYILACVISLLSLIKLISQIIGIDSFSLGLIFGMSCKSFGMLSKFFVTNDYGILLTMLKAGMHIDTKNLKKYIKSIVMIVFATLSCGIICTIILKQIINIDTLSAFIVSTSMCLSSTIVCQNLIDNEDLSHTLHGKLALVGTVAQDFIGIILILLAKTGYANYQIYLKTSIMIISAITMSYFLREYFEACCDYFNKQDREIRIFIFIGLISIIYVFAHLLDIFHLPAEVTILFFGILIKNFFTKYEYILSTIQEYFICDLFISCGSTIEYTHLINSIKHILEIFIIFSIIKYLFMYTFLSFCFKDRESMLRTAILLLPFSEMTVFLIVLLNITGHNAVVLMCVTILSMLVTKYIYLLIDNILNNIRIRTTGVANYAARVCIADMQEYTLIVGVNNISIEIANRLGYLLHNAVVIDNKLDNVINADNKGYFFMDARFSDTYKIINLDKTKCVIINNIEKEELVQIIKTIKSLKPNMKIYLIYPKDYTDEIIISYEKIYKINMKKNEEETVDIVMNEIIDDNN